MMSDKICNDSVCEVNDMLNDINMSSTEDDSNVSVCANCGKEGSDNDMNICNKCKLVKYCNAACKKKHRSKHKKQCERYVAELHDEELFKQPPPKEDCPICFLQLPTLQSGWRYYTCCGKKVCNGCIVAPVYDSQGNEVVERKCPFCRVPTPKEEESIERQKKRVEAGNAEAIHRTGIYYRDGTNGFPQDHTKSLEFWHRAGELGYAHSYFNIGAAYDIGRGVERDEKKARHYYELAAIGGDVDARHNLGVYECNAGNVDRAVKHYMIAVKSGDNDSLKQIQELYYPGGFVAKYEYTKALQLYQAYLSEIKSNQRDKAVEVNNGEFRYY